MINLNKPRLNLSPTVKVISSAIDLCAAFGQKDEGMVKLLAEMREVQEHNQGVLKDANDSYIKATKANHDLSERQAVYDERVTEQNSALNVRAAQITSRETVLSKARTGFDNLKRVTIEDMDKRHKEIQEDREQVTAELREAILQSGRAKLLEKRTNQAERDSEDRIAKINHIAKQMAALVAGL